MANALGGRILIGVADDGQRHPIHEVNALKSDDVDQADED